MANPKPRDRVVPNYAMTRRSSAEERQQLTADIEAFLSGGGEIQQIESGKSGWDATKSLSRQFRLGGTK